MYLGSPFERFVNGKHLSINMHSASLGQVDLVKTSEWISNKHTEP